MIARVVVLLIALLVPLVGAQPPAPCATADECRQHVRDAIAAADYERAHDLAWLAFQKGPKQDPALLSLLARAQSLSGRGDDAFVMLRRLAEAGVVVDDVEDSEDFRRVRAHPQWSQLQALFEGAKSGGEEPSRPPKAAAPLNVSRAPEDALAPKPRPAPEPVKPLAKSTASAPATFTTPPRAADDLIVSAPISQPVAMAYDSVSARFVMGSATSDALTVVSQTSSNAAPFTSRGWSGRAATTAIAVDRAAGDLWVAVADATGASLHRLQLISGRRLEVIDIPGGPTTADLVALAVTADGLFALDRAGHRVYRRTRQSKTLETYVTLAEELKPTGLATSPQALYVAHDAGLVLIDLGSRRQRAVATPKANALQGLRSLAWQNGALLAVQQSAERLHVVRARVSGAGTRVTNVEMLDNAAAPAATLANGVYYYLARDPDQTAPLLRAIKAR